MQLAGRTVARNARLENAMFDASELHSLITLDVFGAEFTGPNLSCSV